MAAKPDLTWQSGKLMVRGLVLVYGAGVMIAQVLILRELLVLALGLKPGSQEDLMLHALSQNESLLPSFLAIPLSPPILNLTTS